jgi:hypothetical protein
MRGAPVRAIQELAGHADLSMTQRYMHLSPAALDAVIKLLDGPQNPRSFGDILKTAANSKGGPAAATTSLACQPKLPGNSRKQRLGYGSTFAKATVDSPSHGLPTVAHAQVGCA